MIDFFNKHLALYYALKSPFLKIKPNTVLFSSFGGQYNDNPKYVSIKLHEDCPDIEQIWVISKKGKELPPPYARIVEYGTEAYFKAIYECKVIVDNHSGVRSSKYPKSIIFSVWHKFLSRRRSGQLSISTWHGTPIKKIMMDEPNARQLYNYYSSTNYVVAGCTYTRDKLMCSLDNKDEIKMYGTPRNDIFFGSNRIKELKQKLGLPQDKKVALFAPTFRNSIEKSGLIQMKDLNLSLLCEKLSSKFGGEWCFVFRAHNLVISQINMKEIDPSGKIVINGNMHDDMAEYLACTDVLINDYSSSMFDFALTQKPCFLYTPDLVEYSSEERGLYMDIRELPFPLSLTTAELIDSIDTFEFSDYKEKINVMLANLGNCENGNASAKIVEDIKNFINK